MGQASTVAIRDLDGDGKPDLVGVSGQVSVMRNPDAGLSALRQPFTVEPLGIALPADAPLLVNLVQNYLATLEYTGLLTRFKAKWLSDDAWLAELP